MLARLIWLSVIDVEVDITVKVISFKTPLMKYIFQLSLLSVKSDVSSLVVHYIPGVWLFCDFCVKITFSNFGTDLVWFQQKMEMSADFKIYTEQSRKLKYEKKTSLNYQNNDTVFKMKKTITVESSIRFFY